ncbi:MAG: hypothetical protein BGP14_01795 [Sphingobacteriales bacterium 44-15]|nr:MAG: hypothetical protein BGP14_01795 [Sphingobacteriales bacterium 44-15]
MLVKIIGLQITLIVMNKLQKLRIISLITIIVLFILNCKPKEKSNYSVTSYNDSIYTDIEDYFLKKKWNFPIEIIDSTLSTKYYLAHNSPIDIPITYKNDIDKISGIYNDFWKIKNLLRGTLTDSLNPNKQGFTVSEPTIIIDTSVFGSMKEPKFYLFFALSAYKINVDTTSHGIPCENCILEENGKIVRYPNGLFFELNETKDSLIFSRWDL